MHKIRPVTAFQHDHALRRNHWPLFINGQWQEAKSGKTMSLSDPATEAVIATAAAAQEDDVDLAVTVAERALISSAWSNLSPAKRAQLLWEIATLIDKNIDELSTMETLTNGKPIANSRAYDVPASAEAFRYYAGWCTKIEGSTKSISLPGEFHSYTRAEPIGVVGLIVPWNFPLLMASWKLAPALAAGCTCVVKPAEQTPLSALRLAELMIEAGIPPGVVNVVPGIGEVAGAGLARHPRVRKLSFTGSTTVGQSIIQAAAGNLKKLSLELGGKAPIIILDDADLPAAIKGAAASIFGNSGQVCVASSRLLAPKKIFGHVVKGITDIAGQIRIGPGLDPSTEMGPLVSAEQRLRVEGYIESGKEQGAKIVSGGGRVGTVGYFVEPTVMLDVRPDMRIFREEIFGPVLVAMSTESIEDLAALANDTAYGLSASIWTRDLSKAHKLAAMLDTGSVWVNCAGATDIAMPFGGYKQSGWGREAGREGIYGFLETKSVVVSL